MATQPRTRLRSTAALVVFIAIPLGLFARGNRAGADSSSLPGFLALYTGDTLWPILFFFIGRFLFPRAPRWRLAAFTLTLTFIIEFAQLWQPTTLQWLREQPVIGFMLGSTFLWSDVVCLVVGSILALLIDAALSACLKSD